MVFSSYYCCLDSGSSQMSPETFIHFGSHGNHFQLGAGVIVESPCLSVHRMHLRVSCWLWEGSWPDSQVPDEAPWHLTGTLTHTVHTHTPYMKRNVSVAQSCLTLCYHMDCARWAPLSMGLSRQERCSGLPRFSPGIFPTQGSSPRLLCLLHCEVGSWPLGQLRSLYIFFFFFFTFHFIIDY